MKRLLVAAVALVLIIPATVFAKTLDEEKVIAKGSLAGYKTVGVKYFTTEDVKYENVDEDEMRKMKGELEDVQEKLAKSTVRGLKDAGLDAFVVRDDEKAGKADMIIEGRITMVNLGSAAARFWVGFGAGSAGLAVKGMVKDAKTGETLATFEHENTSGLRETHDKWEMVVHEADDLGDKISEFIMKIRKK